MKNTQLLSVVFSLIMFTGVTAGTAIAYAESDDSDHDFDDRLEYFCEMTDPEKEQLFIDHPRLAEFEDRLNEYCELDEDEREELIDAFIEEHFPNYEEHDDYDMDDKLDRYCEMSPEDQTAFLEKYPMASDHQDKMEEYCLLDEAGREAFIDEHKDEYKKHDYNMRYMLDKYCEMTDEEKIALIEKHDKAEEHQEKITEYCLLDEAEREAFIDEHKDEYKKHDYNMREKIDKFCEMSEEDKAALIEEHHKSEEHMAKIEEYCSLDEAGRDAFIEEFKDTMKDKISDHRDTMKDKISDHRDTMKDKISDHMDDMENRISEHKSRTILRASTLTDEQKDDVKAMHAELRDFKHSLRDKSISDSDKQVLRDQFMEKAKEFAMTWISPRHQMAAGIDAKMVECREGFSLVMKTSNASPMCVKETTAEKLIERGIAISAI